MYIKRKSAALLITLLIVSSIGLLAIISLRSTILGLAANVRVADNIVAEEASRGGLEYGLTKCGQSATATDSKFFINMEDNSVQTDPIPSPSANSRYADVYITYAPAGTDRLCNIWSIGHIGNTYKKHQVSTVVKLTSGTGTGTAHLFLGDEDKGYFFMSSTYQLKSFAHPGSCDRYRSYMVINGGVLSVLPLVGMPCSGPGIDYYVMSHDPDWITTVFGTVHPISNPAPSVRILKDNGDLVGFLHVFQEVPGFGDISWPGPGLLTDRGRFTNAIVDPEAPAGIHDWMNTLSAIEYSYSQTDGIEIETDYSHSPADIGLNNAFAQAKANYLRIISDYKLHFFVFDESKRKILGELVAYDDSGELGKFQGSALSAAIGFWGGARDTTYFVSLDPSLETDLCVSWNGVPDCPTNFMAAHRGFKYKLKP